jgi:phage terminase small subunit
LTPPTRKLTPKERRFVEEYLVDFNASDAARRAGYSTKGKEKSTPTSDLALRQNASRMLRKPHIQTAITAAMNELASQTRANASRTLQEIEAGAFAAEWSPGKVRCLELLARIQKLLSDEPTVAVTVNVNPAEARERVARRLALLAERN